VRAGAKVARRDRRIGAAQIVCNLIDKCPSPSRNCVAGQIDLKGRLQAQECA
jgi:hypothetical protein